MIAKLISEGICVESFSMDIEMAFFGGGTSTGRHFTKMHTDY